MPGGLKDPKIFIIRLENRSGAKSDWETSSKLKYISKIEKILK